MERHGSRRSGMGASGGVAAEAEGWSRDAGKPGGDSVGTGFVGVEGPGYLAAHESDASTAGAFADGSRPASRRPGGWLGPCADALCPGPEVPKRQSGVGVAVGVPPAEPMARQGFRKPGPPSSRSERGAEGGEASRSRSRARTSAPFRSYWATRT